MIGTLLEILRPNGGTQVVIAFSVGNPPALYRTAPLDIPTLQAMTVVDRRAAIIAAMRAVAVPPAAPNLGQGLQPGDQIDIG